ncbi:unnamed protein product [Heligmosomoides polygyrus]|uniref:SCP domain-containing protein n=1 Tax=Heligmosomoides polygyrus TaxID=6339 RepID=A0A3P7UE02_HELPZ|nr:unnamed protein product [Heligmosomoides polygyrus]
MLFQMAWATTTRLGCGSEQWSILSTNRIVFRGNIVRSRVYDPGEPCSKCPTGTYCVSPLCSTV